MFVCVTPHNVPLSCNKIESVPLRRYTIANAVAPNEETISVATAAPTATLLNVVRPALLVNLVSHCADKFTILSITIPPAFFS